MIFGAFFLHQERNRRQKERKLAKAEKELLHTEQEKLLAQIETKNKELAAKAVSVIKKNKLLIDIRGQLKESLRRVDNHSAQNFRTLNHSIDANLSVDKDWEDFRFQFEKSYPDFIGKLEVKYPSLTEYDRKLCAYLLIGLPVKDIADALHIAHSSAKSSRTRLRKKLNTPQGVELKEFLKEV